MKYTDTLKKSSKKSLIDKIPKRLLELEFKSNHTIIAKEFKTDNQKLKNNVQKLYPKF